MARSAPRRSQARHFSSLPAVANTVAPNARASWIAVLPMPLVPPCTRMLSPAVRCPSWKTLAQTVKKVSGMPAASCMEIPRGAGRHCTPGARQYSAYPPPGTSAQTRSPSRQPESGAAAAMVPATSNPRTGDVPGGGGYWPARCSTSGRFTPAASTRISTSPGPGTGVGTSAICRTSGGPGCAKWIYLITSAAAQGWSLMPPQFPKPARGEEHADFRDHAIHHAGVGRQQFHDAPHIRRGERVHVLLLDDDLLRPIERQAAIPVGHHHALPQQRAFGLVLAHRAGDAVRGPHLELGIVLRVGVGGRDHRDAVRHGVPVEVGDVGHNALGAGDIQGARRVQEVELRIDVEENSSHPRRLECVWPISSRNSRLWITGHGSATSNCRRDGGRI